MPTDRSAAVQARDVMTRDVVTVGPATSAKYAAELMAGRGFAALPVVDGDGRLVGIVAEGDVLRDRLPADPVLHARREPPPATPALLVGGVMTDEVRTVEPTADVADLARLFVDERLRSVPVVDGGTLVGIVSRRDVLRVLVRPDDDIRADVLHLVEAYTGDPGCFAVDVAEGVVTIHRTRRAPQVSKAVEAFALERLARTVGGVVSVSVTTGAEQAPVAAGSPR
jgi:CBS domain-containing protein